jgi:hypothetical protein
MARASAFRRCLSPLSRPARFCQRLRVQSLHPDCRNFRFDEIDSHFLSGK